MSYGLSETAKPLQYIQSFNLALNAIAAIFLNCMHPVTTAASKYMANAVEPTISQHQT